MARTSACDELRDLAGFEARRAVRSVGISISTNGLDLAVHQTLVHGGRVWAVRHREDLRPVEGIGALLRY